MGVPNVCPPLCTWAQLKDGTYSMGDVERFNQTIMEMVDHALEAVQNV